MAATVQSERMNLREYDLVCTATADASGGTSEWIPVARQAVGIDLTVTSGTARVEATACAPSNLQYAVATTSDLGTLSAGASGSTVLNGASHVRLVATGAAQLSVRT